MRGRPRLCRQPRVPGGASLPQATMRAEPSWASLCAPGQSTPPSPGQRAPPVLPALSTQPLLLNLAIPVAQGTRYGHCVTLLSELATCQGPPPPASLPDSFPDPRGWSQRQSVPEASPTWVLSSPSPTMGRQQLKETQARAHGPEAGFPLCGTKGRCRCFAQPMRGHKSFSGVSQAGLWSDSPFPCSLQ